MSSSKSIAKKGLKISKNYKQKLMKEPIDFVVTWVDGNDLSWREEKCKFENNIEKKGNGEERYRDWNQFMYWFRSIEKYAPWVRYVYLITWGHIPEWLNKECPKLKIINHQDYIPKKYLPTFSSIPIELNIYRISDLSEYFVYFNDDTLLSRPVKPEDFFDGGLPKYCALAIPTRNYEYNGPFSHQLFTVRGIINSRFDLRECIERNPEKWFSNVYGEDIKYNMFAYEENYLLGMFFSHLPTPFRKSTFKAVWNECGEELDNTCTHRFRTPEDVMHQIFSLWDIMNGNFSPVSKDYYGKKWGRLSDQYKEIDIALQKQKYRTICLNDSIDVTNENFDRIRTAIDESLEKVFPDKSMFEK